MMRSSDFGPITSPTMMMRQLRVPRLAVGGLPPFAASPLAGGIGSLLNQVPQQGQAPSHAPPGQYISNAVASQYGLGQSPTGYWQTGYGPYAGMSIPALPDRVAAANLTNGIGAIPGDQIAQQTGAAYRAEQANAANKKPSFLKRFGIPLALAAITGGLGLAGIGPLSMLAGAGEGAAAGGVGAGLAETGLGSLGPSVLSPAEAFGTGAGAVGSAGPAAINAGFGALGDAASLGGGAGAFTNAGGQDFLIGNAGTPAETADLAGAPGVGFGGASAAPAGPPLPPDITGTPGIGFGGATAPAASGSSLPSWLRNLIPGPLQTLGSGLSDVAQFVTQNPAARLTTSAILAALTNSANKNLAQQQAQNAAASQAARTAGINLGPPPPAQFQRQQTSFAGFDPTTYGTAAQPAAHAFFQNVPLKGGGAVAPARARAQPNLGLQAATTSSAGYMNPTLWPFLLAASMAHDSERDREGSDWATGQVQDEGPVMRALRGADMGWGPMARGGLARFADGGEAEAEARMQVYMEQLRRANQERMVEYLQRLRSIPEGDVDIPRVGSPLAAQRAPQQALPGVVGDYELQMLQMLQQNPDSPYTAQLLQSLGGGHARGGPIGALSLLRRQRPPRLVQGPGTGQSDQIPAMLSDGEYVVPSDVVSALGDGSTDKGAQKLDAMRSGVRKKKGMTAGLPPAAGNPADYMGGA